MKTKTSALAFLSLILLAAPISAQPEERRDDGGRPRGVARERILRAFDRDGDGRLNQEEREAVREQLGERFEEIRRQARELFEDRRDDEARIRRPGRPDGERDRPQRRGDDRDRPRDRGARDRRWPEGLRGPMGPMRGRPERDLQALFGWFDMDGDNALDRREFAELAHFVQRYRPMPPRGPDGPRFGWRGPGGPAGARATEFRRLERRREFDTNRRREGRDRRDDVRPDRGEQYRARRQRDDSPRPDRPNREGGARPAENREAAYQTIEAI